ncbi:sulfurtransferase TusA [Enterobacteriaceae endosymbiont of Donacia bicoloricornis]|uniref:sulfurtransferase TusA family protein n=1 Tax=Enterobacteriaceae endosymbiont of Donacia bicoloricornis TaxID=2675772 RepID=UPI001448C9F3|nr:sulfurtransferase TusA family protein [Enterobacteriaceae endosymbiont of Donacia bicoloricornis]QJC37572.1 sulfurtransferase TusA [Enterobacteriaceae endosymbiont of Donacia bicoloricornis]
MIKKNNFYKNVNHILDIQGLQCPNTIMMIKKKTLQIKKNETLLIITNDLLVNTDIKYFCHFMNYNIIDKKIYDNKYFFLIKKL